MTPLTPAELVTLHYIAAGLTRPQIAARRGVSINTVKKHAAAVLRKMGARCKTQAAIMFLYGVGAGYTVEIAAPRVKPEQGGMWE